MPPRCRCHLTQPGDEATAVTGRECRGLYSTGVPIQMTPPSVSDGTVELLWHSDYYIEFQKVRNRWLAEDSTFSGGFTWTNAGEPVDWEPATGDPGWCRATFTPATTG